MNNITKKFEELVDKIFPTNLPTRIMGEVKFLHYRKYYIMVLIAAAINFICSLMVLGAKIIEKDLLNYSHVMLSNLEFDFDMITTSLGLIWSELPGYEIAFSFGSFMVLIAISLILMRRINLVKSFTIIN
jgi:hypothetical protein